MFGQGRCGIKHACKRTWCIRCCSVCFCSCFVPELSLFACACSVLPAVLVLLCQQSLSAGWLPEVSKSRAAQHGGSSVFLVGKIASMRLFGLTIVSTFCEIVVFFCSFWASACLWGLGRVMGATIGCVQSAAVLSCFCPAFVLLLC